MKKLFLIVVLVFGVIGVNLSTAPVADAGPLRAVVRCAAKIARVPAKIAVRAAGRTLRAAGGVARGGVKGAGRSGRACCCSKN